MVSKAWKNVGLATALAGTATLGPWTSGSLLVAQEKSESRAETRAETKNTEPEAAGKYWIGIHALPIMDEALLAQLNLKDRLIVWQVMPDSPSAKAGLKRYDILLKYGDRDLATLQDLIQAVNDHGEIEATMLVLRGGKETPLKVTPTARPSEDVLLKFHQLAPQEMRPWLESRHADGLGRFNLRMLGPGIAAGAFGQAPPSFPKGLSLSVSKENDEPAKIVAKKDGKTYETTEDKLGELPEDIRHHVQGLLAPPQIAVFSNETLKNLQGASPQVQEELKKAIESAKKQGFELRSRVEEDAKGARNRVEIRRLESGPIGELRKEVDALRQEVEKLKGKDTSADKRESAEKSRDEK